MIASRGTGYLHCVVATTWIAELPVVFVHNGRRADGRIAVGRPIGSASGEARCTVALDGLEKPYTIFGEGTLQALLLALQFLGFRLHDFVGRGGRIVRRVEDGGEDVGLDAIFGPLLREPVVPPPVRKRRSAPSRAEAKPTRSRRKVDG